MCVVSVKVDENVLRDVNPELNTMVAIREWAQHLVDLRIQEMVVEDNEMIDLETVREKLHQMVREVY
jgi:hypothetical protein